MLRFGPLFRNNPSSLVWQSYQRKGGWSLYFFEVMTDQQTITFRPELYLDIGLVREVKKRALMELKSQEPATGTDHRLVVNFDHWNGSASGG